MSHSKRVMDKHFVHIQLSDGKCIAWPDCKYVFENRGNGRIREFLKIIFGSLLVVGFFFAVGWGFPIASEMHKAMVENHE